jgi:hypothetical protein
VSWHTCCAKVVVGDARSPAANSPQERRSGGCMLSRLIGEWAIDCTWTWWMDIKSDGKCINTGRKKVDEGLRLGWMLRQTGG